MPLPNSNLPTSSLPWAREIEKELNTLNNTTRINEINNSFRDATNETNIANLSELLADQIELRTYSLELDLADSSPRTFIGSPGLPTPVYIDTSKLVHNIYLNKTRNFLIDFSSYYGIQTYFANNSNAYDWAITCEIYVDGVMVDFQSTIKSVSSTPALGYDTEQGSISLVKMVPVSAGQHTVSMKIAYSTSSTGATTIMGLSGDNFIVTVVQ